MNKYSRKKQKNSEVEEIMNILDKNYFHICIELANNNIKEFIKKEIELFDLKNKLTEKMNNILDIFMCVVIIVTSLNVIIFKNLFLSVILLILAVCIGILSITLNELLSKCFFKELKNIEERYIKEKIYYERTDFVNEIMLERPKNEKV